MKKILLLSVFVFVFCFVQAQNIYSEKSGKIVYRYEIGGEQTNFSLFFDDFGKKQVMDIEQKVEGVMEHVKTIITDKEILIINFADKQVIKMPVTADESGMMGGADQGIDVEALVKNATQNGGSKIGTETLLGKECMVYQLNTSGHKGKYWIYNNYLVKAEFVAEGVHTYMEAKELQLGIAIPASEFQAPAGFTVTDMSQMQDMMKMFGAPE